MATRKRVDPMRTMAAALRSAASALATGHANCGGGEDNVFARPLGKVRAALAMEPLTSDLIAAALAWGETWHSRRPHPEEEARIDNLLRAIKAYRRAGARRRA